MKPTRRSLLATTALLPVSACGIFSSTTTNGVTTITVNVQKLSTLTTAINGFAPLLLALIPGGAVAAPIVASIGAAVATDINALSAETNGQETLSFNNTSVPAALQSLLGDAQKSVTDAQGAIQQGQIPSGSLTTANLYITALETVLGELEDAISPPSTVAAARAPTGMSLATATSILARKQ
jgi:hypothetical protein